MKSLRLTQKQYNDLNGINGGLVILTIRILIGIILSFLNAFLTYSYISWGFRFSDIYPIIYIMLGFLYFIDALLLFRQKRAFVAMYVVTAAAFVLISASFQGYSCLLYAGVEVLLMMYLFRSRRAAVYFRIKNIIITDINYENIPMKVIPERFQMDHNKPNE